MIETGVRIDARESAVAYELEKRLVIGIASSALFDLAEADAVFREQGGRSTAPTRNSTSTTRWAKASPSPSSADCCP